MFAKQRRRRAALLSLPMTLLMLLSLLLGWIPGRAQAQDPFDATLQHDFEFAARQLNATLAAVAVNRYPSTTKPDGSWNTTDAGSWTSGFFPGSLWLMYQRTGAAAWQTAAAQRQSAIEGEKNDTSTHDVGFKIFTSFGNGARLTNDAAYRQVVLTGAGSLAKRYSATVGSIRSSGSIDDMNNFQVIIDNMMNLEILFWAARNGGAHELYDMAVSHALTARANQVRADGSTYQVVTYDPRSGAVKSKGTNQGYSSESTWSRGQAWALYGFTMAYRETGDARFLETARQTADYFINHLPADKVPYWDFELPSTAGQPRDSSAAAIAASGLLELSRLDPDSANQQRDLDSAKSILTALSSPAYLAEGTGYRSILLHGTRNNRSSDTDSHDTGLSYGDYYFLEALLRVPSQPIPTGTVTGRVIDRAANTPIAGATIGSSRGTATTDANGSYTISAIAAGSQAISASAAGYAPATQTVAVPANGSVAANFALDRLAGAPIKLITFEGGSLTGPSGADSVSGSGATLLTSAPLKGAASARVQGTAYLQQGFSAVDDFYASFYLQLLAAPASSARIARISNAGTTVGNLVLATSRALQLRNGSSSVGSPSAALGLAVIYRVGLHQRRGAGGNAILEAFLAEGDAPFPAAPFARIANGTWTTQANQLQLGATNGHAIDAVFDDLALDAAAMPGPGGGAQPPPDTQPPTTPAGLSAAALSASQIRLTWSPATDNIGVAGYRVYRDGGATPLATVTGGTSYTDGGLAPATTHSYTVAAFDAAGNQSQQSAAASATTLATPPPPSGLPIKAITFEGGGLTGASGADSLSGSGVTLDTATPLRGSASAQFASSSGFLSEDFTAVDEVFVSFYLRLSALPSSDTRIAFISNGGTTVGNIVLRPTGELRLRVGSATIGESAALAVKPAIYRVGLHQKRGTGGNAVLEAFLAPAGAAFGPPFATTATGAWTTQANRLRFGATNGQSTNATFDDILLDAAAMPGAPL